MTATTCNFIKNKKSTYLLVGSPNVGKSTYFNRITWKISPVGNVDRLTTFVYSAKLRKNKNINVVDLPGINTLNVQGDDEIQSLDCLINSKYDGVINIVSANSLARDLFLTYELAEAGALSYVVINMIDELKDKQIKKLSLTNEFKVPVSLISAKKNIDINETLHSINLGNLKKNELKITYNEKIEKVIKKALGVIPNDILSKRFLIVQAICENRQVIERLKSAGVYIKLQKIFDKFSINKIDADEILNKKWNLVNQLVDKLYIEINEQNFINETKLKKNNTSKFLTISDRIFFHPWIAVPFFVFLIAGIYFLTFYEYAGGYIQNLFAVEGLGQLQTIISDGINSLSTSDSQIWWAGFVGDGLLGGIFTIIGFLPWLLILTFLISIIEQVGLLSRMAVIFDKIFNRFGLSGRSVINLVVGIGCNVPSILLAKNANSVKERVVSIFIIPFVSCSARILVFGYIGNIMLGTSLGWIMNLTMTFISVAVALGIGYFFSNIMFRKKSTLFITEIPPFRSPNFIVLIKKMILESWEFIRRTILYVGIANLIIWILLFTNPTTIFHNNIDNTDSFLYYISYPFKYVLYPIGLGFDWRFSVSIISAFPAKEIIVSNIETLFGNQDAFINSLASSTMLFNAVLLSFLTFICFYIPCLATIWIMLKEVGKKYTIIHIVTSLLFAYVSSLIVFTFVGAFEMLIKSTDFNAINYYVSLMAFIGLAIYLLICIYSTRQYLWKINYTWTNRKLLMYQSTKYFLWFAIAGITITTNVLLLI